MPSKKRKRESTGKDYNENSNNNVKKVDVRKRIKRWQNSISNKHTKEPSNKKKDVIYKVTKKTKQNDKHVFKSKETLTGGQARDRSKEKPKDTEPEKPTLPPISIEHATIMICGAGDLSQLGLGEDVTEAKRPLPIESLSDITVHGADAGGISNIVLVTNSEGVRQVWTWGCNDSYSLGRTTKGFAQETTPAPIPSLNNIDIIQVSAGDNHMMALTSDGTLYTWGCYRDINGVMGFKEHSKEQKQLNPEIMKELKWKKEKVVQIASGENSSYAITNMGVLYLWGDSRINARTSTREKNRSRLLTPSRIPCKLKFNSIAAGAFHIMLIDTNQELYSMGLNNYGQLGNLDYQNTNLTTFRPYFVNGFPSGTKIKMAAVGSYHSMALTTDGHVYSWGRGDYGQLGHGDFEDKLVPTLIEHFEHLPNNDKIVYISAGSHHSIALTESGDAYSWGFGEMWQLGIGEDKDANKPTKLNNTDPRSKLIGTRVVMADGGGQHSIFVVVPARNSLVQ